MINQEKIKILFIDDDKATNFINKYVAKSCDKIDSIFLLQSGFEAISFLEECAVDSSKKPDLIFLDINMPAMNGWEFLEAFYKLDETLVNNTKIIILSSSDDPQDLNKFREDKKLLGFIRKPFNVEALNSVLVKI